MLTVCSLVIHFSCDGALTKADLFAAARSGDIGLLDGCLSTIDVNKQSAKGKNTPLHIAVIFGKIEMVKHLVDGHDADVNILNKQGRTVLRKALELHVKKRQKMVQIITILLKSPTTDPTMSEKYDQTPFAYFIENRDSFSLGEFNSLLLLMLKLKKIDFDDLVNDSILKNSCTVFDVLFDLLKSDRYKNDTFAEFKKHFFLAVFRNSSNRDDLKKVMYFSDECDADTLKIALSSFMNVNRNRLDLIKDLPHVGTIDA